MVRAINRTHCVVGRGGAPFAHAARKLSGPMASAAHKMHHRCATTAHCISTNLERPLLPTLPSLLDRYNVYNDQHILNVHHYSIIMILTPLEHSSSHVSNATTT